MDMARKKDVDPRVQFGLRLRELRLASDLSQEELAHRAGVDRTYVSSCERGRRNVSLVTLHKFARTLGVKPTALLEPPVSAGEFP